MQDLRSLPGGATGRIFGVSGGGGTVAAGRLRPHPPQNLRCPRCDSLNTKFCYYNNYNLSQPRHFCKSCRRYWTKGGVLRNVPVGGGCRKSSKRSSSSSKSSKSSKSSRDYCNVDTPAVAPNSAAAASSSDSSSLTANAADAPTAPFEPASTPPPPLDSYSTTLLGSLNEGAAPPTAADTFLETGSFTSLIAAAGNPDVLGLNFTNASQFHLLPTHQPKTALLPQQRIDMVGGEIKLPGIPVDDRYMDQIAHMDMLQPPQGTSAPIPPPLPAFDWQGGVDLSAGLFDGAGVSIAGDHGCYWNHSQWGEIDPSLFLP